jgi:hypothetical protein
MRSNQFGKTNKRSRKFNFKTPQPEKIGFSPTSKKTKNKSISQSQYNDFLDYSMKM